MLVDLPTSALRSTLQPLPLACLHYPDCRFRGSRLRGMVWYDTVVATWGVCCSKTLQVDAAQVEGGFIQSLGWVLKEELLWGDARDGRSWIPVRILRTHRHITRNKTRTHTAQYR